MINLPGKVRSKVLKEANERMKSIFQIDLQTKVCRLSAVIILCEDTEGGCLRVMYQYFKRQRGKKETSLLRFTLQYDGPFSTMKSIKKYCRDDKKGVKVGACTNNLNLTVNYSKLMSINVSF